MKRLFLALVAISALTCAQAAIIVFDFWTGELSGAQEVPPNSSTASGGEVAGGILYDDVTNLLEVNAAYGMFGWNPLEGNYSGSHISQGAIGDTGLFVVDLKPIQVSLNPRYGFYQGSVTIPQGYEASLLNGGLYMNIESAKYPLGEIRGQLQAVPEPVGTWALLGMVLAGLWLRHKPRS